jgi:hypothetical protein
MSVPAVTIERPMNLAELVLARQACIPRPSWCVIFSKAFALVARSHPELRRSYLKFPWPRLYEHPYSTVSLNIERTRPNGEPIVTQCLIKRVENRSLHQLDEIVRRCHVEPLEDMRWYQRALSLSKVPRPFRRWAWWASLNVIGRLRCHNFGTFGISSVAAQGAGIVRITLLLTAMLHYGLFDKAGNLDMRLTWDHRVFDGVNGASILMELERTLSGEILTELRGMRQRLAA